MTERFAQYDGGKGPEDRSDATKRAHCPLWKQVKLDDGRRLTPEEAATMITNLEADNEDLNKRYHNLVDSIKR